MERFAVIIPDRGDRPDFTKFCLQQLDRMTVKPSEIVHVDFQPVDDSFDLVERVHFGTMAVEGMGIDLAFIIENDDYYPADYFERFGDMSADIFGDDMTFYYNIKLKSFSNYYHPGRSSLFTTGFRLSAFKTFQWGGDQFLDLRLWSWANEQKLKTRFSSGGTVGIKHGIGLCGGKGHKMKLKNTDFNYKWLSKMVDVEALEFYKEMHYKLQ